MKVFFRHSMVSLIALNASRQKESQSASKHGSAAHPSPGIWNCNYSVLGTPTPGRLNSLNHALPALLTSPSCMHK